MKLKVTGIALGLAVVTTPILNANEHHHHHSKEKKSAIARLFSFFANGTLFTVGAATTAVGSYVAYESHTFRNMNILSKGIYILTKHNFFTNKGFTEKEADAATNKVINVLDNSATVPAAGTAAAIGVVAMGCGLVGMWNSVVN